MSLEAQPSSKERDQLRSVRDLLAERGLLNESTIAARLKEENGHRLVDLHTPVPSTSLLEPVDLSDPEALQVIRHSLAHVMADAVQRLFPGTKIAFGPPTRDGFYYDYDKASPPFGEEDLKRIEALMREIVAQDLPFQREVLSPEEARNRLSKAGETYKLEHLERLIARGEEITFYHHGNWSDLCEGPHVPSTRFLKAFRLTGVAGAYWRGIETNPMLQRIYGIAFADEATLEKHLARLEEAKQRDHRKLGKELELFAFHPWAPAAPFFLPRGALVYNALIDYVRSLYRRFGYLEVITPQVFDRELFLTSGHLPTYSANMFFAASEEGLALIREDLEKAILQEDKAPELAALMKEGVRFALKPMNCPAHALIFKMERRSHRELPLRLADFGRLHRFERSGVTQGLTRVRSFCQDDAHIFCSIDQVQGEIEAFIDLLFGVYKDFGFEGSQIVVATRPEVRIGSDENWNRAEEALFTALRQKGLPFEIAEGEGAFYGPKVEFHLEDAIGRSWQLGTIQVDFNMAERFDLSFVGPDNTPHRPVVLHRAILGSIERFLGVLIEHTAGAFPLWLAPEHIILLTVSERYNAYAQEVLREMQAKGVRAIADLSSEKLGAKIRKARLMRIPYRGVIGEREAQSQTISLTQRDGNQELGALPVQAVIERILSEITPPSMRSSPN
ncbi:MAG: threonine--tRNA ligase [Sandaracinaceae bacterium]|nr:threonine--tRNA ligase [Sandaracinaceae bacterium]